MLSDLICIQWKEDTSCTEGDYNSGDISGIIYKYSHLTWKAKKEM